MRHSLICKIKNVIVSLLLALLSAGSLAALMIVQPIQAIEPSQLSLSSKTVFKSAGLYTAVFSYKNTASTKIAIAKEAQTLTGIETKDIQLPTQFEPGEKHAALLIDITCESKVAWTLQLHGEKVSAEAQAPRCGNSTKNERTQQESSCSNPKGWIEDKDARNDEYTKYYWLPNNDNVSVDQTPQANPESFNYKACVFAERVLYKDLGGVFQEIQNTWIKEENGDYSYRSTGNSYSVFASKDPSKGFRLVTHNNEELTIDEIRVGNAKINTKAEAIFDKNKLLYQEFLPNIDFQLTLNTDGISKAFILKNQDALKNPLQKIELISKDTGAKKTNKLVEQSAEIQAIVSEKLSTNQKTPTIETITEAGKTLDAKVDELEKKLPEKEVLKDLPKEEKDKKLKIAEEKEYLETIKTEVENLQSSIKNKPEKVENNELKTEIERIQNTPNKYDTLKLSKHSILSGKPVWFDPSQDQSKPLSFEVSQDGTTLSLLPDLKSFDNEKTQYPIIIDPAYNVFRDGAKDTWVTLNYPDSARGNNNTFQVTVGGNSYNGGNVYDSNPNAARAYLSFNNPRSDLDVKSASIHLWQYSHEGGEFNTNIWKLCNDFDEWGMTWNNQAGWCGGPITNMWIHGRWNDWVHSANIAGAVQKGSGRIGVVISDVEESMSVLRNGNFCSKDTWAYDWATKCTDNWKIPYLDIDYNNQPHTPNATGVRSISENDSVYNNDFVTGCDMSTNYNAWQCNRTHTVQYNISNVSDPDEGCQNPNVKVTIN